MGEEAPPGEEGDPSISLLPHPSYPAMTMKKSSRFQVSPR